MKKTVSRQQYLFVYFCKLREWKQCQKQLTAIIYKRDLNYYKDIHYEFGYCSEYCNVYARYLDLCNTLERMRFNLDMMGSAPKWLVD